jgi:flagellar hook-associated protein 3 FlgL
MRISSGMIFDAGVSGINRNTASLLHVQQQISANRRILTPSDDPVAAARALEVQQASDVIAQFKQNQSAATSALGLEEGQLNSATDILARVRELTIQAGNTSLTTSQRQSITIELRARFGDLLGIANATGGDGQSTFAGYMGSTTPFAGSVDNLIAGNEIVYQGDDGQRKLQVSPSRSIAISDSGNDVFTRIRSGNGTFVTDYASTNTGTGAITVGSVTNPAAWNVSAVKNVAVNFSVTGGVTTYDLVDAVSGNSLLTGGVAPAPVASQRVFQSGQPIVLAAQGAEPAFDLGASLVVNGAPASGDKFSVAPSSSQSVFKTLANLIGALEASTGTPGADAKYISEIGFAVTNLDQASSNILRVRAQIGSSMNEIDSLESLNDSLGLQYQQTLSNLQDLDYAKAISDLTHQQTSLQAAQQSFVKIAQLSLFNFL